MKKNNDIYSKVKKTLPLLQLILAIMAILSIIVSAYFAIKLAPLYQDIAIIQSDVKANEILDETDHQKFVTKDALESLNEDVKHINTRVDQIYNILAK